MGSFQGWPARKKSGHKKKPGKQQFPDSDSSGRSVRARRSRPAGLGGRVRP